MLEIWSIVLKQINFNFNPISPGSFRHSFHHDQGEYINFPPTKIQKKLLSGLESSLHYKVTREISF